MIEVYPAYQRIDGQPRLYRQERLRATLAVMPDVVGANTSLVALSEAIMDVATNINDEHPSDENDHYLFGLSLGGIPGSDVLDKPYNAIINFVARGINPETGTPSVVDAQFWASEETYDAFRDGGWLAVVDHRGPLHYALKDILAGPLVAMDMPGWYVPVGERTLIDVEGEQPFVYGQRVAEEAIEDIDDIPKHLREHLLGAVAAYYAHVPSEE